MSLQKLGFEYHKIQKKSSLGLQVTQMFDLSSTLICTMCKNIHVSIRLRHNSVL
jgi:hypothetical protein